MQLLHTFHNYLHITHKTMDYTQGLCSSHPSLVLSQSIQFLEYGLYLAVPQQLVREFLCGTLSHGQCTCDSVLTEPPLINLFRCQGKHREDGYLDEDIGHYRSGRDRRIDLQTLEEIPQALKEIKKGIVTRCDPTGGLAYSYITRELFEEYV